MSDDIFTRFYTTTSEDDDKRVRDGCGHLHPEAGRAVECAFRRGDFPVVVDRGGRLILPMDPALDTALADALGTVEGGVAWKLAMRVDGSAAHPSIPGGGGWWHDPR